MSKADEKVESDEMRKEYDFSAGVRGKFASRYECGSNVVVLEPDVARLYPNAREVNRALRALANAEPKQTAGKAD